MGEGKEEVIAIVDVETTGVNPERDRVIEFAVQKGFDADSFRQVWRVNPGVPIPAAASAVHGITDADVADKPPFSALIPVVQKILTGADIIVGYNVEFDLRCLASEFKRFNAPAPDLTGKLIIDPLRIWRHFEPRRLEDAVKRFAGVEHTTAHSAEGDVYATGLVLKGMLREFGLDKMNWGEISNVLEPDRASWVGPSSHLRWKDGEPTFNFGKHHSRTVHEVISNSDGYAQWIIERDFPEHVREIVKAATELPKGEFLSWIQQKFPFHGSA